MLISCRRLLFVRIGSSDEYVRLVYVYVLTECACLMKMSLYKVDTAGVKLLESNLVSMEESSTQLVLPEKTDEQSF